MYTIGVDFGTLSGRGVLVDAETGAVAAERECPYPHGVMTALPGGMPLPAGWAIQDPMDYLSVLEQTVPALLRDGGVPPERVGGISWDVTACTMLPAKADGTPLSETPEYRDEPHAYVKMWKHLSAHPQALRIEGRMNRLDPTLLRRYGGKVSSQWMLPKALQIWEEAPSVYRDADLFLEMVDWLVLRLTGQLRRNTCCAGFKSFWSPEGGYPDFGAVHPGLSGLAEGKLRGPMAAPWEAVGRLTPRWAARLGLSEDTVVAGGIVDAHSGVLGSGITEPGSLLLIMGTSTCHLLLGEGETAVPGICGSCKDAILPGRYAYEAGQACVGDMLDWFVRTQTPPVVTEQAAARGISVHALLSEQAGRLRPGESGLLALDWWNGQRSPLVDDRLSGLILGMTLRTTPAEEYRALMEATAYGTRWILDTFQDAGVPVREVAACGGIVGKNPVMMQIYADVLGRPIRTAASAQSPALGAAVLAATAAGAYDTVDGAVRGMTKPSGGLYRPDAVNAAVYDALYREFRTLADWFGGNGVMARLYRLSRQG